MMRIDVIYSLLFFVLILSSILCGTFAVDSAQPTPSPTSSPTDYNLLSAQFVSDGSSINVYFPVEIEISGSRVFQCFSLFSFVGINTAICQWTKNDVVNIKFQPGVPAVKAGEDIVVFGGLYVGAPGTIYPVRVLKPLNPTVPVVVLPRQLTVVPCFSPSLDLTMSRGSGGRDWDVVNITVASDAASVADMVIFLQGEYDSFKNMEIVDIPISLLENGKSYTITVELCNFLDSCSKSSMILNVQEEPTPLFSIMGAQNREVSVASELNVAVLPAVFISCEGAELVSTQSGLFYNWSISTGASVLTHLKSSSKDPTKFRLPRNSLVSGVSYDITVVAWHMSRPQDGSSALVRMLVTQGPIVSLVLGGAEQLLGLAQQLVLDASGSYDSNADGAWLLLSWSCVTASPAASSCPSLVLSDESGDSSFKKLGVSYTGGAFQPFVYSLVLTVADAGDTLRFVTETVRVTLLASGAPIVALSSSHTSSKVNAQDALKLTAVVTVFSQEELAWEVLDDVLSADDLLVLPASQPLTAGSYTVATLPVLSQMAHDIPYTFVVRVGRRLPL
jgi:hypothetical protein